MPSAADTFISNIPRFSLGLLPTPLHPLELPEAREQGVELLVKRDDLTGLAFGGNKTRKLEFLLGAAVAQGCDAVVTGGAAQSNHCRQTAAAAARAGMECHLALGGQEVSPTGNLLLDDLLGARIHWCGAQRKGEQIPSIMEDLRREGRHPFLIPYGGSNPTGALGFVAAGRELSEQLDHLDERRTTVVIASSSGGTQAGLMVASQSAEKPFSVLGVGIDREDFAAGSFVTRVEDLAAQVASLSGLSPKSLHGATISDRFLGEGYGVVSEGERKMLLKMARSTGLLLDPVYTVRAFTGLVQLISEGRFSRGERVIFWHTGGTPALFHYGERLLGQESEKE